MTFALSPRNRLARLRDRWRDEPRLSIGQLVRRHWLGLSLMTLAVGGVVALDAWALTCGFQGCPSPAEIRAFHPSEGGAIVDRSGRLIGRLANVPRVNVPLSAVPKHVQAAFIATEDRRFYQHGGIDWRGFVRAASRNVTHLGVREGFSTITMQVVHNSFLSGRYHGRTLKRKLIEMRIARLVEGTLTKDQILEHYLNVIYLGSGVYGVEAASRDLFGKSVNRLSLAEAAVLAGLPKAPSTYTPTRNPRLAVQRRNVVLGLLAEQGYVSASTAQAAQGEALRIADADWRPSTGEELTALDAVRALVDSVVPDVLKEGDVVVHTTLDAALQRAADRTVARHAAAITRETAGTYGVREPAQGALVAMDPGTGDVRALVPGRRTSAQRGGFNRVYRARRQPGSAFKPFVYAAALQAGWAPSTIVDDEPVEVTMGRQVWRPANYNDEYHGQVTLRRALEFSANAATVRVSRNVGERNIVEVAHRNGIVSPLNPVPSLALGAVEVTPLELVTAYAPFANGGARVKPRLVTRIEAPDGTLLWSSEVQTQPVMDAREAFELTSMLRAVVDFGTGRAIRDYGITVPVAGKTGTTNNGADVWFVGYTPTLLAGIWFGYDTPRPIAENASGGRLAAPAWAEFYQQSGWREPKNVGWVPPDGMVMRVIDPESGLLATEWCPRRTRDFFKPQSAPNEPCDIHTAPAQPVIADDGAIDPNGPGAARGGNAVEQIGRGLGRTLRRIFRF